MTANMSTADALTERLLEHGTSRVFAVPGVQNDHLFDSFARAGDALQVIHTRHEQGAAYMALGSAMATGSPAVFSVVPGPGILNTAAALVTALACNAPVVGVTGQIPQNLIGRGFGILHEIPDQLATLRSISKNAWRIEQPDEAASITDLAFLEATSGRPGPTLIECPMDVWPKSLSGALKEQGIRRPQPKQADEARLKEAAVLLKSARRPVIVVGGGAQHASEEVTQLASRLHAPVIAHRMGHGILDARDPLACNIVAGAEHWRNADVAVGIGTRLHLQRSGWGTDDSLAIIRIEIDPAELTRGKAANVPILGDAKIELKRLLSILDNLEEEPKGRAAYIAQTRHAAQQSIAYLEPQLTLLTAIRQELPDNAIFVDELTQLGYAARLGFPVYEPRTFLSPGYQGTLGWGLPVAMGAKVACPDKPVVLVSGDGGFMFNVQELATCAQHDIAVVVVLVNDGAFGNVQRTQIEDFASRKIASDLINPDFVKLAQSFGLCGERVISIETFQSALRKALDRTKTTILELKMDDILAMPSPWKFLRPTRLR